MGKRKVIYEFRLPGKPPIVVYRNGIRQIVIGQQTGSRSISLPKFRNLDDLRRFLDETKRAIEGVQYAAKR